MEAKYGCSGKQTGRDDDVNGLLSLVKVNYVHYFGKR